MGGKHVRGTMGGIGWGVSDEHNQSPLYICMKSQRILKINLLKNTDIGYGLHWNLTLYANTNTELYFHVFISLDSIAIFSPLSSTPMTDWTSQQIFFHRNMLHALAQSWKTYLEAIEFELSKDRVTRRNKNL